MTIFQVECFIAVAIHLNFAQAAKQLHISQPAVTRQIQTLETELHVKLFSRSTRNVQLTAEGRAFLTDARTIAAASKRAIHRFSLQDEEEVTEFHIGYSSVFHLEFLTEALRTLSADYPQVHPRLHPTAGSHLPASVDAESLDAALSCRSPKEKSSLMYRELKKSSYVCVCRRDCPLASLDLVTADDLRPYAMIIQDPGTLLPEVISDQWEWADEKKPSRLYFCESTESSMLLVSAGLGVTIIPDVYVPKHPDLAVCALESSKKISFGLYFKRGRDTAYMKEFAGLVKAYFEKQ
ncbi:MAG: LysR family transcriptional regulator [Eubacteriales bacterium]|nr:LysR family transcriptional regulator [Eubacteriales bacterium]